MSLQRNCQVQIVYGTSGNSLCSRTAMPMSFHSYPNWKLEVKSVEPEANGTPVCSIQPAIIKKIITQHLADILTYPEKIWQCFECGAFVVSIKDRPGHSVALDKCHEMCIKT